MKRGHIHSSRDKAKPIRILVVDDHPITRIGIVAILRTQDNMEVCGEAGSVSEAIGAFEHSHPDVVLMDLQLPDGDVIEAIRHMRAIDPIAKIVVVTTYEGDEDIHQALQAGAIGYLIKGLSHETLLRAILKVSRGNSFLPPAVAQALGSRVVEQLSIRELDVLKLIVAGKTNREIGEELAIKEATVKGYVTEILAHLGVTDRTQAAVIVLRRGLEHL